MKYLLTLLVIVCSVSVVLGQDSTLEIRGGVYDAGKEAVPYARVNVFLSTDSAQKYEALTDYDGLFEIKLPTGKYFLCVSFLGQESAKIAIQDIKGVVRLDSVFLQAGNAKLLSGVEVIGEKNQMSLQIDKRVFNVSADLNNQGANASDMLRNIPSITVDAEGNVSLRGSQSVRILVDGKVSGFTSSADALQQLQADMIDKVEIITNASARYEAQGESGIINIILKKNQKPGVNGALTIRTGYFPDNAIGGNINYSRNKFKVMASANLLQRIVKGQSTTSQTLQNADTAFKYFQDYTHDRGKLGFNGNLGVEYELNATNLVSVAMGIRSGLGDNKYYRRYDNFTVADKYLSSSTRNEQNEERESMLETTIGYTKKIKSIDGEWKTSFRWFVDKDFEDSDYDESATNAYGELLQRSNAYITERMALLQSDLILPIKGIGKVELGIRGHNRDFDNRFGFGTWDGASWTQPANFNDRFNYKEKVYASYVMASNTYGKLSVQAGLRGEYSEIFTRQYSATNRDTRDYLNFFPSVAFSLKQSEINTFQLSYSRRINRPGQWDIMPFMKFGDNREMRIGNPDIDPELTDSYEGSLLNAWENGSLLSSVYYRHTKNKFENIAFFGNDGIIYRKVQNIANRDAVGVELNANYNPVKWVRLATGFNFFKEVIKGRVDSQSFDVENFSWTNRTSINISLPKRLRFQLSANYEAPRATPQGKRLEMFFMDFGMSKDVLKNRATLGLNVIDIFNSRKWRGVTNTPEIQSATMFQWSRRSIRVTFTYRFNQQPKALSNKENLIEASGGGE